MPKHPRKTRHRCCSYCTSHIAGVSADSRIFAAVTRGVTGHLHIDTSLLVTFSTARIPLRAVQQKLVFQLCSLCSQPTSYSVRKALLKAQTSCSQQATKGFLLTVSFYQVSQGCSPDYSGRYLAAALTPALRCCKCHQRRSTEQALRTSRPFCNRSMLLVDCQYSLCKKRVACISWQSCLTPRLSWQNAVHTCTARATRCSQIQVRQIG